MRKFNVWLNIDETRKCINWFAKSATDCKLDILVLTRKTAAELDIRVEIPFWDTDSA